MRRMVVIFCSVKVVGAPCWSGSAVIDDDNATFVTLGVGSAAVVMDDDNATLVTVGDGSPGAKMDDANDNA
jgi:hypothetical protein